MYGRGAGFHLIEEPHISLSRTLVLKHFMINAVLQSLRPALWRHSGAEASLAGGACLLENEERTTTFLALRLVSGSSLLDRLVDDVDREACDLFGLPRYYTDRCYHMSLFWRPGGMARLTPAARALQTRLDDLLDQVTASQGDMYLSSPLDDLLQFDVDQIMFKSGCKLFRIPLRSGSAD